MKLKWDDDKILNIIPVLIIAIFILLIYVLYADSVEMKVQECKITNEWRPVVYFQTIYGSKGEFIAMIPMQYIEHKYLCNDHERWR